MSERERLHEIIEGLPQQQVQALLALLDPGQAIRDEELEQRLTEAPEEDADDETVARILAAEAEQGESVSHDELKHRLGV